MELTPARANNDQRPKCKVCNLLSPQTHSYTYSPIMKYKQGNKQESNEPVELISLQAGTGKRETVVISIFEYVGYNGNNAHVSSYTERQTFFVHHLDCIKKVHKIRSKKRILEYSEPTLSI